jgi:hypothetical protein
MFRLRRSELLIVAVFAACIAFQLFVPPSVGLANNGDFAKMIGRFALGPAIGDTSDEYKYFTAHWIFDPKFYWLADERSSELLPIDLALFVGWQLGRDQFDVRILGAIHALVWIGCFAALLPMVRRFGYIPAIAALFVLSDVSYIAYCNTFYRDTATFLFLAWAVVLWLHFMFSEKSALLYGLYLAAAALTIASKAQHAPLAIFFLILAVVAALEFGGIWRKVVASLAALVLVPIAWSTFDQVRGGEKLAQVYAVIFTKILNKSREPDRDASELGLGPEYLQYAGHWPGLDGPNPMDDAGWRQEFERRTGQGAIVRFYLHHPRRAMIIIYRDLHSAAAHRTTGLGNYERDTGHAPYSQTGAFAWWSAIRSALFRVAPWHILVWYAGFVAFSIYALWFHRRIAILGMMLAGMGIIELGISALGDAGETDRHLFVFHVITDFTILAALTGALLWKAARAKVKLRPDVPVAPQS